MVARLGWDYTLGQSIPNRLGNGIDCPHDLAARKRYRRVTRDSRLAGSILRVVLQLISKRESLLVCGDYFRGISCVLMVQFFPIVTMKNQKPRNRTNKH